MGEKGTGALSAKDMIVSRRPGELYPRHSRETRATGKRAGVKGVEARAGEGSKSVQLRSPLPGQNQRQGCNLRGKGAAPGAPLRFEEG
eukprot:1886432-Heterocapsa_arctica.AAC.1